MKEFIREQLLGAKARFVEDDVTEIPRLTRVLAFVIGVILFPVIVTFRISRAIAKELVRTAALYYTSATILPLSDERFVERVNEIEAELEAGLIRCELRQGLVDIGPFFENPEMGVSVRPASDQDDPLAKRLPQA